MDNERPHQTKTKNISILILMIRPSERVHTGKSNTLIRSLTTVPKCLIMFNCIHSISKHPGFFSINTSRDRDWFSSGNLVT